MPRPRKKGEYVEEKARAKARLDAQDEHDSKLFHRKGGKKRWLTALATHIGKAVDRIDPLELAATLALTYLVKTTIDASEELVAKIKKTSDKIAVSGRPVSSFFAEPFGFATQIGFYLAGEVTGNVETPTEEEKEHALGIGLPDQLEWILAFIVAFILVRHGAQILGMFQDGLIPLTEILLSFLPK